MGSIKKQESDDNTEVPSAGLQTWLDELFKRGQLITGDECMGKFDFIQMPNPDDICEPAMEGEPSDLEMVIYVNPSLANDVWANGLTVGEVVAVFRDLVMRGVVKVSIIPGDNDAIE